MPCQVPPPEDGPAGLARLKAESGLSDVALGHLVGVSGPTILSWRTRDKVPTYPYRVVLQVLTTELDERGRVVRPGIPLDAWDPEEAKIISRAKPLAQLLAERG